MEEGPSQIDPGREEESEETLRDQGEMGRGGYDHVVQDGDAHDFSGVSQGFANFDVFGGRCRIIRRMIVAQDEVRRIGQDGL